uniref:Solute carrier family 4 member 7 n=1 Tax=Hucho hucho TaxID=62062 RepID=A0A4W5Q137_9TELE
MFLWAERPNGGTTAATDTTARGETALTVKMDEILLPMVAKTSSLSHLNDCFIHCPQISSLAVSPFSSPVSYTKPFTVLFPLIFPLVVLHYPSSTCTPCVSDTPSQRVQFILGTEDDDEEHMPHDLFTELDELFFRDGHVYEWRETARWLKFEEDVEDGGERWSKPYVATLSLHSLFELRSCILNGTVMLDMRANTIEEIADMVIDSMVASAQLEEGLRQKVREAMLKRHHHQNEKKLSNRIPLVRSFADIGKKQSDPHLLERNGLLASPQSAPGNLENSKPSESRINGGSRENSTVDFSKVDMNFMKKIPPGAEASNVLVGEVEFLERPIIAFIRLSPAVLLTGLTEVPVPTRFLFLLLGPFGKGPQYHEIGRSIATLMTDEVFHDVAYKAKDRNDLLSGIDEFLDQVTVLPPGEWDPTIRIEPPKSVPSQDKRKVPSVPNGSAHNESFKEDQHQAGPELQRTGRWVSLTHKHTQWVFFKSPLMKRSCQTEWSPWQLIIKAL